MKFQHDCNYSIATCDGLDSGHHTPESPSPTHDPTLCFNFFTDPGIGRLARISRKSLTGVTEGGTWGREHASLGPNPASYPLGHTLLGRPTRDLRVQRLLLITAVAPRAPRLDLLWSQGTQSPGRWHSLVPVGRAVLHCGEPRESRGLPRCPGQCAAVSARGPSWRVSNSVLTPGVPPLQPCGAFRKAQGPWGV